MANGQIETFKGKAITVISDPTRCMFAGECGGSGLKAVFSKENWINPDGADVEKIVDVIERCPASSLKYQRMDGAPQEAPEINSIQPFPDSALYVRGDIKVTDTEGNTIAEEMRLALCRCGHSKNKPFCDGSHGAEKFEDEAAVGENQLSARALDTTGRLNVTALPGGPLLVDGNFVLRNATNTRRGYGNKTALCRCGASANKPFCDGKHTDIGFEG